MRYAVDQNISSSNAQQPAQFITGCSRRRRPTGIAYHPTDLRAAAAAAAASERASQGHVSTDQVSDAMATDFTARLRRLSGARATARRPTATVRAQN